MTFFDKGEAADPTRPGARDPLVDTVLSGEGITPHTSAPDDPRLFACIVSFADGVTLAQLRTGEGLFTGPDADHHAGIWRENFNLPRLYEAFEEASRGLPGRRSGAVADLGLVTAFVTLRLLALVRDAGDALGGRAQIVCLGASFIQREGEATETPRRLARHDVDAIARRKPGGTPRCVLAVVDDAIAFANARFRNGTSTRLSRYWAQTDTTSPALVQFLGKRLDSGQISDLIDANTVGGEVDEAGVYRDAGVLDFSLPGRTALGLRATHGTAVMDLAAGAPPDGASEEVALFAVQLPRQAVADTTLERLEPFILHAFVWIIYEALVLASTENTWLLPVVINLSFGDTAGPHDGTGVLETAMEFLSNLMPPEARVTFVLPSGNSHLARGHARFELARGSEAASPIKALPWRIQPDDKTISIVQVWTPQFTLPLSAPRLRVRLLPPGGGAAHATAWHIEGNAQSPTGYGPNNAPLAEVGWQYWPTGQGTGRGVFVITVEPTALFDTRPAGTPNRPVALPGVWTIEVALIPPDEGGPQQPEPVNLHAFVERDDTPANFRSRGRQSYFDAACYQRSRTATQQAGGRPGRMPAGAPLETDDGACFVVREGSINGIATGCSPVIVAAILKRQRRPSPYSAGGPTQTPQCAGEPMRLGPDVGAIADTSLVHRGVLAAGTYSGSVLPASGTSAAAPRIARMLCDQVLAGAQPSRSAIRMLAAPITAVPERTGAGLVAVPPLYPVKRIDG